MMDNDDTESESPTFIERLTTTNAFPKSRLIGFLSLHCLTFAAQLTAIVNFSWTRDYLFRVLLIIPWVFSGLFCAHAAWNCETPALGWKCLPLKNKSLPLALLLAIPFGLFQLVIIFLALEEYHSRNAILLRERSHHKPAPANKFHCKAVNGMFEGFLSSSVLLYAYWSINFPQDHHITEGYRGEEILLGITGMIAFLQSGVGLLELDHCTSRTISRRMRRSLWYEVLHYIFRLCEVTSRVSIFVGFMVLSRQKLSWFWVPITAEMVVTGLLVASYGGAEGWLARILCSVPCTFANIFLFVDSPYKQRAARRLSRCLTIKNAVETIGLPVLLFAFVDDVYDEVQEWWTRYIWTNSLSAASIPLYWGLLLWLHRRKRKEDVVDIFTACSKRDSVSDVRKAIGYLTKSTAIGLNINCFDIEGHTPMMFAARKGHDSVCRFLIREGAKIDVRVFRKEVGFSIRSWLDTSVRRGWTALHMAAHKGHVQVVRAFLEAGQGERNNSDQSLNSDNFVDSFGETPLHVAASSGHAEIYKLLAERHPRWIPVQNENLKTALELVKSDEMKQSLSSIDGGRAVPLMYEASSPTTPPMPLDQAWQQIQLEILRSGENLSAPGLCSYIASSCGGALGKVFLEESDDTTNQHFPLPSISEADTESLASSFRPSLSRQPSNIVQEDMPDMEKLQPINRNGEVVYIAAAFNRPQIESDQRSCNCCSRHQARSPSLASDQLYKFRYIPDDAIVGEGAYGMVWRAKDTLSSKWYAVKNIKTQRRGDAAIANRECEVANCIKLTPHPCLVSLYHVRHFAEIYQYCLVMEFCPGGDLTNAIQKAKSDALKAIRVYTPPALAYEWIGQIFLGLEHMHKRMQTLLRDLKTDNVVLTSRGQAKLTDFGFGRFGVEAPGATWSFGIPAGSPGYVAPEILTKEPYDFKADLYSFGVLSWVLLTGGLKSCQFPRPPVGRGDRGNFECHYLDWYLLQQCITYPDQHDAIALSSATKSFVSQLTYELPDSRFNHERIRSDPFMEQLQLPPFHEPPRSVDAWLASRIQAATVAP